VVENGVDVQPQAVAFRRRRDVGATGVDVGRRNDDRVPEEERLSSCVESPR
jgi:hypothetical protein